MRACYSGRDFYVTWHGLPRLRPVEAFPREVVVCQADDGREPFSEWLDSLDPVTEAYVIERLDRVERGLLGDHSSVGGGVSELRIDHGPGYRIYFGQAGREIHLISGGQKKRQQQDIIAAQRFWKSHD
ncbi:type II toxin-antitoxin system RelE/ParE family toxin [Tunturiibacter gelidoferens]|uniref:type II toxin-antitoxin system RelE/ParE family toxin n=1 Tax=Tunturiibacter gelidiferens TaxID=3069689 RepID=UPI0016175DDC|nr:type II toxin-antitoxin system RelE/ParE family toxin [Edaphobacter lichenicola]